MKLEFSLQTLMAAFAKPLLPAGRFNSRNFKNYNMSKELKLSRWGAEERLLLFLKLRKGKEISEKTISDFGKLLDKMWKNFKDCDDIAIPEYRDKDNQIKFLALKAIRCGFIKWEGGGNARLTDIDDFSYYKDDKHRAKIKGELREISERDFATLEYVFFGER